MERNNAKSEHTSWYLTTRIRNSFKQRTQAFHSTKHVPLRATENRWKAKGVCQNRKIIHLRLGNKHYTGILSCFIFNSRIYGLKCSVVHKSPVLLFRHGLLIHELYTKRASNMASLTNEKCSKLRQMLSDLASLGRDMDRHRFVDGNASGEPETIWHSPRSRS